LQEVFIKATPNKIVRYLSDNELEDLLKVCETSLWDRLCLLVILAIMTGMRKSELINIRWTDIDFDAGLAKVDTYRAVMIDS
jgi:integrase